MAAGVQSTLCHTVKCTSRNENKSSNFGGQKLKKTIKQKPGLQNIIQQTWFTIYEKSRQKGRGPGGKGPGGGGPGEGGPGEG